MNRSRAIAAFDSLVGKQVGEWKVVDFLGNGASGLVVKSENESTTAALKIIDPELEEIYGSENQEARIELECQLSGHEQPNLVKIFGGGRCSKTNYLYLAMEVVDFPTLTSLIPSFPREQIRNVIHQISEAAKFLEGLGIAHRDIKPDNIVVKGDFERAVLLDLGVAAPIDGRIEVEANTGDAFLGTTRYSPPEYVMREEGSGEDGWRAVTFYQLGAVLHDMIMRKPIFHEIRGPAGRVIEAVRYTQPIIEATDVPEDLLQLSLNCLQKNWELRLQLVCWDDFFGPKPLESLDAIQDRIEKRFTINAEQQGQQRTLTRGIRRVLEDECSHIGDTLREVSLESGLFPPVRIFPEIYETEGRVCLQTGPSDQHMLDCVLQVVLSVSIIDSSAPVVRIRGCCSHGPAPSDIPENVWIDVYVGEISVPTFRDRLNRLVHLSLDAAQANAAGSSQGFLQIGRFK